MHCYYSINAMSYNQRKTHIMINRLLNIAIIKIYFRIIKTAQEKLSSREIHEPSSVMENFLSTS